eukprot:TRINITY_DN4278_c1_g3_i1.p1 TRINITY_DN4278_c1_g3~~TRINITY_DN4278_c1_g3_i1.p1  ORF type:complete len:637 (-),score=173.54 TRINITY_DN4278_c1_g3_i1:92-2002(-)
MGPSFLDDFQRTHPAPPSAYKDRQFYLNQMYLRQMNGMDNTSLFPAPPAINLNITPMNLSASNPEEPPKRRRGRPPKNAPKVTPPPKIASNEPRHYMCAKCGEPKKGHTCKFEDVDDDDEDEKKKKRKKNPPTTLDLNTSPAQSARKKESQSHRAAAYSPFVKPIAIIGAGIAGIAAAQRLRGLGFQNIVILEGRERIGGRIHTITSEELKPGCGIDIGAAFIHGIDDNPITTLCNQLGVNLSTAHGDYPIYDEDGSIISESTEEKIGKNFQDILDIADSIRGKSSHYLNRRYNAQKDFSEASSDPKLLETEVINLQEDISLGKVLDTIVNEWQSKEDAEKLTKSDLRILNWYYSNLEAPLGATLRDVSVQHWDIDANSFKGDHAFIQEGFGYLVNELAKGLDIQLANKVERVLVHPDGKSISLETPKGAFIACRVLCTLPLGILKARHVEFLPGLGAQKEGAIQRMGYGLLNKLVLFFPKCFWDAASDNIAFASSNRGEFYLFVNMQKVVESPVLVAYISGGAALQTETLSGEEVVNKAINILQRIYGASIPGPLRAVVTRWACDQFALGSYSYLQPGGSPDDYDILGQPINNRIFFAGEHTSRDHPASVVGAYLSGIRAANQIVESLEKSEQEG